MTDWDRILKQKPISEAYNINPPNFMNIYETLAFYGLFHFLSDIQKQTVKKSRIEGVLKKFGVDTDD